jgi:hypothetical protein
MLGGSATTLATIGASPAHAMASQGWQLTNRANAQLSPVAGYTDRSSVPVGSSFDILVRVDSTIAVRAEVYRMGWYSGARGELVASLGTSMLHRSPSPAEFNSWSAKLENDGGLAELAAEIRDSAAYSA